MAGEPNQRGVSQGPGVDREGEEALQDPMETRRQARLQPGGRFQDIQGKTNIRPKCFHIMRMSISGGQKRSFAGVYFLSE